MIAGFGGPRRTPGESVEALDEAIDVIRLLWSKEHAVSLEGKHYRLDGAHPGPQPVHPIGIWVGAFKPRMLRLVGRKADGWLPSLGVLDRDESRAGHGVIDAAAEKAGRDPASIRRILNLQGVIGDQPPPRRSELPVGYLAGEPLAGPAEWWVETLAGFVDDGFDPRSSSGRWSPNPNRSSGSPRTWSRSSGAARPLRPWPSGKRTPVSSSETSQSRRATSASLAASDRPTSFGAPRCSMKPPGPAKLSPGMSATAA